VAERLAGPNRDVKTVAARLLGSCRVLVSTIHRTYLMRALATKRYDVLLVDEAAMCTLPDVFAAAKLVGRRVTFFGDFRQLPAVVHASSPSARRWLHRDPFQAHRLDAAIREDRATPGMAMLREQRRMAEPICRLVSEGWYNGELTTAGSVRRRPSPFSDRWNAVTLLDTASLRPVARIDQDERTNPVHAQVVGGLFDELIDYGDLLPRIPEGPTAMLLTPYCGQADLLYQVGRQRRLGRALHVSTVHGAQGAEADTVVLDLADGRGARLSGFLGARRFEDIGARLLNVALSRARHRLFVVADTDFLLREAPRDGAVRMLLHLLNEHGAIEDAAALIRTRPDRRIAG
jgi:superfamily I DNA and/or RNA helicase